MKRILSLIIAMMLLLTLPSLAAPDTYELTPEQERQVYNQSHALVTLEALQDLFPRGTSEIDFLAHRGYIYPDFIGGYYLDEDGHLVVQIVSAHIDVDREIYDQVRALLADAENVTIGYVTFSYTEIHEMIDTLNNMSDENRELFSNVSGWGDNTRNNSVTVWLYVYNEEEIAQFRSTIMDSPILAFEQGGWAELDGAGGAPESDAQNEGNAWFAGGAPGVVDGVGGWVTASRAIPPWLWLTLPIIFLLGGAAFLLWERQKRRTAALQTVNGGIEMRSDAISRKQAVDAVRNSGSVPERDVFTAIIKKIDKAE